jgi:uncharacterized protein HemY
VIDIASRVCRETLPSENPYYSDFAFLAADAAHSMGDNSTARQYAAKIDDSTFGRLNPYLTTERRLWLLREKLQG